MEVDSRAIIEALRKIYHADALVNELTGGDGRPNPQNKMRKATHKQQ